MQDRVEAAHSVLLRTTVEIPVRVSGDEVMPRTMTVSEFVIFHMVDISTGESRIDTEGTMDILERIVRDLLPPAVDFCWSVDCDGAHIHLGNEKLPVTTTTWISRIDGTMPVIGGDISYLLVAWPAD